MEDSIKEPTVPTVSFEDFCKTQLVVGKILSAEPIIKATKLLNLKVDVGEQSAITIVAGIAEYFVAEALVGRKVTVVRNLEPRLMRGIESQGMILMAETPEGRLSFIGPDSDDVIGGAKIS